MLRGLQVLTWVLVAFLLSGCAASPAVRASRPADSSPEASASTSSQAASQPEALSTYKDYQATVDAVFGGKKSTTALESVATGRELAADRLASEKLRKQGRRQRG